MRSFQPPTRRFFVGLKNMSIIQLLINEGHEDKKKQQVLAEASDILRVLNKGESSDIDTTEQKQENDLNDKTSGTERRWIVCKKKKIKKKV